MKLIAAALVFSLTCVAAHAAQDSERLDALFKEGLAAERAGRYDVAIDNFRSLLSQAPTPRVKLELARALYLAGQYPESIAQFREIYEQPGTPQTVKRNIIPFMREAELRVMRVRYGARMVTSSNPSRVGEEGSYYVPLLAGSLDYQPPVPKKVAYGVEPWASVEKLWQNGLLTKFYGAARLYKDSDLNEGQFQFAVARQVPSTKGLFVQAALDAGVGKDDYYVLPSVEVWKRFRLSNRAGFGVGSQVGYMKSHNEGASGGFYRPYVFGDWTFLSNATVFGRLSLEHLDARNSYYSYVTPKIDFGIALSVGGVNLTPQLTLSKTVFQDYDIFWGKKREDVTWKPALSISWDRLEWHGVRPELNVFYEKRESNIDIYDYNQVGGFINLARVF